MPNDGCVIFRALFPITVQSPTCVICHRVDGFLQSPLHFFESNSIPFYPIIGFIIRRLRGPSRQYYTSIITKFVVYFSVVVAIMKGSYEFFHSFFHVTIVTNIVVVIIIVIINSINSIMIVHVDVGHHAQLSVVLSGESRYMGGNMWSRRPRMRRARIFSPLSLELKKY
jgi:hypothetical protein